MFGRICLATNLAGASSLPKSSLKKNQFVSFFRNEVKLTVPDTYGIFKFRILYRRPGFSVLHYESQVSIFITLRKASIKIKILNIHIPIALKLLFFAL